MEDGLSILIGLKRPMGCIVLVFEIRIMRAFTKVLRGLRQPKCQKFEKNSGALRKKISERERAP